MTRFRNVILLGTWTVLLGGCGTVLGLNDFEIDENLEETAGDGDGDGDGDQGGTGADGSGGDGSGGDNLGGNASGGNPGSGGSDPDECNDDCDDGNECTTDACIMRECAHTTVPAGEACSGGVCNGISGAPECVRCVDDQSGDDTDSGCGDGAPRCNDAGTPLCTGCTEHDDCDDGNECTNDSCNGDGECIVTTEEAGTSCSGGVCNGIENAESCETCIDDETGVTTDSGCDGSAPLCDTQSTNQCVECLDDEAGMNVDTGCNAGTPLCDAGVCVECTNNGHCDDTISCTVDTCNAGSCGNNGDNSLCPYNGSTGKCGACNPSSGCEDGDDPTEGSELLSNGNFDAGAVNWTQSSSCCGDSSIIVTYASLDDHSFPRHSAPQLAWLGGLDDETSILTQGDLSLPNGTVGINIQTFMYRETRETDDDDQAWMTLRNEAGTNSVEVRRWVSEDSLAWEEFNDTVDISSWSGDTIVLEYEAQTNPDSTPGMGTEHSSFFVDTLSVKPLVCQ